MSLSRYEITARGIVQGVGFRPFVYRLATSLGLYGQVNNASACVSIDVEGPEQDLQAFIHRLRSELPPLARITEITVTPQPPCGYTAFVITESAPNARGDERIYISPDIALCADCRRELLDPADRRYRYPLINCTNCGPRFSIITGVPYDRAQTTMRAFPLCADCARDYTDPADRRYHAEPVACPVCGPRVSLAGADGRVRAEGPDAMAQAVAALRDGQILAIKGLGGYHLACNALDEMAVRRLRQRKARDEKPFAVMAADLATAERYCEIDDTERALLQSTASPIVLLRKRPDTGLPAEVAPGNPALGVMLPYTPLHLLLFQELAQNSPWRARVPASIITGDDQHVEHGLSHLHGRARGDARASDYSLDLLVMTSGNISGEPVCYHDAEAFEKLHGIADAFLLHNRDINTRVDDSVTRVVMGQEMLIRRSRGYVPLPLVVAGHAARPSVLACGGQLKNTFCLNRGEAFYLSHHIGDLENFETLEAFERGIALFEQILGITPTALAYDLHPNYLSTQYALAQALPQIGIQHHRAHIAACLADNQLTEPVIGVAFDGTGYGDDGHIWGGEFFTGDLRHLQRVGQLEYVRIPGGDSAMAEPWKTALGYLTHAGCADAADRVLAEIPAEKRALVGAMLAQNFNTYRTSSVGRLFDAASAIIGLRHVASYEGQAAMELEYACRRDDAGAQPRWYPFAITPGDATFTISLDGIVQGLLEERMQGRPTGAIAVSFHETVARFILDGCRAARAGSGLRAVALSGGVFQNAYLLQRVSSLLTADGFTVYSHHRVPANDGGLALGQAVLTLASL
jgi:hydrogenase maturation protein HypF